MKNLNNVIFTSMTSKTGVLIFLFFISGCSSLSSSKGSVKDWVSKNEVNLYFALISSLKNEIIDIKQKKGIYSEAYTFTKYDKTVLGDLANKVFMTDTCLVMEYTVYNHLKKIDLIIKRQGDFSCGGKKNEAIPDTLFLSYFKVILPSGLRVPTSR